MEIEVGKRYITSNGNRVFVRKKTDHPLFPFQGEAEGFDGILSYTKDGRFTVTGGHPFNITSEAITGSLNESGGEKVAVGEKNVTLTPPPDPRKVYEGVCIDGPLDGCKYAHRSKTMKCEKFVSYSIDAGPGYTRSVPHEPIEYHFFTIHDGPHKAYGVWTTHAHDERIAFHVYHAIHDRFTEAEADDNG